MTKNDLICQLLRHMLENADQDVDRRIFRSRLNIDRADIREIVGAVENLITMSKPQLAALRWQYGLPILPSRL